MATKQSKRKDDEPGAARPMDVPLVRARDILGELANRVEFGKERILVTRRGRPALALVSIADYERLTEVVAA
jgi:prevent-host-death family protein